MSAIIFIEHDCFFLKKCRLMAALSRCFFNPPPPLSKLCTVFMMLILSFIGFLGTQYYLKQYLKFIQYNKRLYIYYLTIVYYLWFMVFNTTFNNISVISWWPVLLVKEKGLPRENHWPVASHWQTLSHNVVSSTTPHERGSNSQLWWW